MQDTSKAVVLEIIHSLNPKTILDAPCGGGWLGQGLKIPVQIDGVDLYDTPNSNYRKVIKADLDKGIPDILGEYDCVVACEGLEHLGNPELFIRTASQHLKQEGTILISVPNVWYPQAKLQYLIRGFFPSFPCLVGKIKRGTHMHLIPWSLPQIYLFLRLADFKDIQVHYEPLSESKHFYEKIFAIPQLLYCNRKLKKSASSEEEEFWGLALSKSSLYGRHLIITARKI